MHEVVRIKGMQDPRLEATPRRVESETPETRGQIFGRLVRTAVSHKIVQEKHWGDASSVDKQQADEGMATVRDEFRQTFLGQQMTDLDDLRQQAFDAIVDMHVAKHYQKERDARDNARVVQEVADAIRQRRDAMAGDWSVINREFPGQFNGQASPPPFTLHFRENTKRSYPHPTGGNNPA